MKKLLKISLLIGLFMAMLTITSKAETLQAEVTYTVEQSSVVVKATLPQDPSSNTEFCNAVTSDGWTLDGTTMTKRVTNTDEKPYFEYYSCTIGDLTQTITIATPFTMKVNDTREFQTDGATIGEISNSSVIEKVSTTKIKAKAVGSSTVEVKQGTDVVYNWKVTVVEASEDEPETNTYTAEFIPNSNISVPLVIKGLPAGKNYYYTVDTNKTTPYDSSFHQLLQDNDGTYKSSSPVNNLIQLNSDLYAHIYDTTTNHSLVADIKIKKPISADYNKFDDASHATYSNTQILFYLPYALDKTETPRKIHFKIGKITDNSILVAIKNGDKSAFDNLKKLAINDTNPIIDKNVQATLFHGYNTSEGLTSGKNFVDKAYYYLYAELDDENGKYIPVDSITLTRASVYPTKDYAWYLFFYGTSDFNFDGIVDPAIPSNNNSSATDQNASPKKLPATGEKAIILSLVGASIIAFVVLFRKTRKI